MHFSEKCQFPPKKTCICFFRGKVSEFSGIPCFRGMVSEFSGGKVSEFLENLNPNLFFRGKVSEFSGILTPTFLWKGFGIFGNFNHNCFFVERSRNFREFQPDFFFFRGKVSEFSGI